MATTQSPDAHGKKENEMVGMHNLPLIDTSWTWATAHLYGNQLWGVCGDYELAFTKCVGKVGVKRAPVECKKLHDDFAECAYHIKGLQRIHLMQRERKRRGLPYQEMPPKDSIRAWYHGE